jgi:hypothetical protein
MKSSIHSDAAHDDSFGGRCAVTATGLIGADSAAPSNLAWGFSRFMKHSGQSTSSMETRRSRRGFTSELRQARRVSMKDTS